MFDNELKSISDFSNNSEKYINKNLDEIYKYIKTKNKGFTWLLPFIKTIKANSSFILGIFFILSLYFSNQFIYLFYNFILIDSIVLSVLVLQNEVDKYNSRRLAKNVISMFILNFNFFGSFVSVMMVFAIYFGFNKFLNKIIFKVIEVIINFLSITFPFIKDLYPNIKLIDHNKPIGSTEAFTMSSESSTDDVEDDLSFKKKEHKMYKKLIEKHKK